MKRTEKIEIRVTKMEKEKFLEMQAKLGYSSMSEMIRHILNGIRVFEYVGNDKTYA